MAKQLLNFFVDIFETIVVAAAIFLVVYVFLVQPHRVQGDSMLPNFKNGELILTDKLTFRFREPIRGEVIIFKAPPDRNKDFIKRVVGLPGEKIKIEDGLVFINGEVLTENYLLENTKSVPGSFLAESEQITVDKTTYVVLGDNRSHSSDSREWGTIKRDEIIGRALLRYWPLSSFTLLL